MPLVRTLLLCLLDVARGLRGIRAPPASPAPPPPPVGASAVPLFSHIPKNGGSWVTAELDRRGLPSFQVPAGCSKVPCDRSHVPVGLAMEEGCEKPGYRAGQQLFTVLRHPYQRAVSQWLWGHREWKRALGYTLTAEGMNRFIQDSISNASVTESLGVTPDGRTCITPEPWQRNCGRFIQGCHWLPQSDYIFTNNYSQPLITNLLNQSTLTQELRLLLGDATITRALSSSFRTKFSNSWICALTQETKNLLDRHFAVDFEKFGHLFNRTNYVREPCKEGQRPINWVAGE